jgi:hypothetical protein
MGLWFAIKHTGDHGDIAHKWRKNDSRLMIIGDYIYISNVSGLAVVRVFISGYHPNLDG